MWDYIHNHHSWSIENLRLTSESNFQETLSVNLWSGILNGQLIGPFELPDRLNGEAYLGFLRHDLNGLLEEVDLLTRRNMIFQNDGAPCHFARIVRQHLDERFGIRWIGRGGPIAWPPRSPDLNPIDFFVWGYYKELVYAKESSNRAELRTKLSLAEETINPCMFSDFASFSSYEVAAFVGTPASRKISVVVVHKTL